MSFLGISALWGGGTVKVGEAVTGNFTWQPHLEAMLGPVAFPLFTSELETVKKKMDQPGRSAVDNALLALMTIIEVDRRRTLEKQKGKHFKEFSDKYADFCRLLDHVTTAPSSVEFIQTILSYLGQSLDVFPMSFALNEMLKSLSPEQQEVVRTRASCSLEIPLEIQRAVEEKEHEKRFVLSSVPCVAQGGIYTGCRWVLSKEGELTVQLTVYIPGYELLQVEIAVQDEKLKSEDSDFPETFMLLRAILSGGERAVFDASEKVEGSRAVFLRFREDVLRSWCWLTAVAGQPLPEEESTERKIISQLNQLLRKAKERLGDQFLQFVQELDSYLSSQDNNFQQTYSQLATPYPYSESVSEVESRLFGYHLSLLRTPVARQWLKVIVQDIQHPVIRVTDLKESLPLFVLIGRRGDLEEEVRGLLLEALASPHLYLVVSWIVENLPPDDLKPLVCFLKNKTDEGLLRLMERWTQMQGLEVSITKGAVALIPALTGMQQYRAVAGIKTYESLKKLTASAETRHIIEWMARMHVQSSNKRLIGVYMPFLLATPEGNDLETAGSMHLFGTLNQYFGLAETYEMSIELQTILYESLSETGRRVAVNKQIAIASRTKELYKEESTVGRADFLEIRPELWMASFEAFLRCLKPITAGGK